MVWSTSMTTVVSPMFIAPWVDEQTILTFMLAVVDNSNDTDSDKVNITVNKKDEPPAPDPPIDDNGKNKITICHVPPGNPDNAHTITVGEPAVIAHVAHGDSIGACESESENKTSNFGKGNNDKDDDEDRKDDCSN